MSNRRVREVIREKDGPPVRYVEEVVCRYDVAQRTLALTVDNAVSGSLRFLDDKDEPVAEDVNISHSADPEYGYWFIKEGTNEIWMWMYFTATSEYHLGIRNVVRYEYIDKTDGARCIGQVVLFGEKTEE